MLRRVFLLSVMAFSVSVSIFMIWPVLSIYAYQDVGVTKPEVGIITAAAFVTALFLRVPFSLGLKTEHFTLALIGGLIANTVALAGYGLSHDIFSLLGFRVLHGIAVALDYTLMLTLSSMIVTDEAEMTSSIESYTTALALGLVTGPAIGTLLVSSISLRSLMFVASVLGIAAIAAGTGFLREVHGIWGGFQSSRVKLRDLLMVLRKGGVTAAAATYLTFSTAYGALTAYAPLKGKLELGLTDQYVSMLFFMYFFIVFAVRLFLGRLRKRIGILVLLYGALASAGAGMLLIGLAPAVPLFTLGFALVGLSHGLVFPLTASVAAHTTPPYARVTGNAIFLTSFDLGNVIGPSIASLIVSVAPISLTLAAISIIPFLGILTVSFIKRMGFQ